MWTTTEEYGYWLSVPNYGRINLHQVEAVIASPKIVDGCSDVDVLVVGTSGKTYSIATCKDRELAVKFIDELFKQITQNIDSQSEKTG